MILIYLDRYAKTRCILSLLSLFAKQSFLSTPTHSVSVSNKFFVSPIHYPAITLLPTAVVRPTETPQLLIKLPGLQIISAFYLLNLIVIHTLLPWQSMLENEIMWQQHWINQRLALGQRAISIVPALPILKESLQLTYSVFKLKP